MGEYALAIGGQRHGPATFSHSTLEIHDFKAVVRGSR